MAWNSTGYGNIGLGHNTLFNASSGFNNIAIGSGVLYNVSTSSNCIGIGNGALFNNTVSNNIGIGNESLNKNTTGAAQAALGSLALKFNTTGGSNTAVGHASLGLNTTGNNNTGVGRDSLFNSSTGSNNTGIGYQTLYNVSLGIGNVALGYQSLNQAISDYNIGVGYQAGQTITNLTNSLSLGKSVNATKSRQILIGNTTDYDELDIMVSGAVGINTTSPNPLYELDVNGITDTTTLFTSTIDTPSAGSLTIGNTSATSIAIGKSGVTTNITGTFQVNGVAYSSGGGGGTTFSSTQTNTSYGYQSLNTITSGLSNTAIGYRSNAYSTGSYNTTVGNMAGLGSAGTTGYQNTAIGHYSLAAITSGYQNVAMGDNALSANNTGFYNTGIGSAALLATNSGSFNTGIGFQSLQNITTGTHNIGLGYNNGPSTGNSGLTYTMALGDAVIPTKSSQILIGNTTNYTELDIMVNGPVGINTTSPNALYELDVSGITGTSSLFTTNIDSATATTLSIGNTSATQVNIGGSDVFKLFDTGYSSQYRNANVATDGIMDLYSNWSVTRNNVFRITSDGSVNASSNITCGSITSKGVLTVNSGATSSVPTIITSPSINGSESSIGFYQNTNAGGAKWVMGHNTGAAGSNVFGIWSSTYNANVLTINSTAAITAPGQINAGAFNTTSDYRIKSNVCSVINSSYDSAFSQLNPVYYFNKNSSHNEFGFIAHEVGDIYPELVTGKKDEEGTLQRINYTGIIPLCVNEIQKMEQKILELNNKLEHALNRINLLESY
jgi:hypothetical protein